MFSHMVFPILLFYETRVLFALNKDIRMLSILLAYPRTKRAVVVVIAW